MPDTANSRLLLLSLPGNEGLASSLATKLGVSTHEVKVHRFPDEECLVTVDGDVAARDIFVVCTLDQPDTKLAPLLFAADAVRELGARRVGLVAPYLAYMRQDKRFHPGEAVSARTFAHILSAHFDHLITVDPHLHRYHALGEIYRIPTQVVSAAPAIAKWIDQSVERPLLIGPDGESAQWIEATAGLIGAPFTVLEKQRFGDKDVTVSLPDVEAWRDRTPVLLDDIISSGRTMIAAAERIAELGLAAPACVGVHALMPGDALAHLQAAPINRIVSCNTVVHASNTIDLSPALAEAMADVAEHWLPNPE